MPKTLKYTRRDVEFNNLSFLARPLRTIDKGDMRFHVNHFLVEEDRSAVSTNGSVLHWVKHVPLVAGFYKPKKVHRNMLEIEFVCKVEEAPLNYPDYKDILHDWAKETGPYVSIDLDSDDKPGYSRALATIIRTMSKECMNITWLEILTDGPWEGYIRDENPNYFHQGERKALIMPMRL